MIASSERPIGRALPGVPAAQLSTAELTAELHRRGLVVLDGKTPRRLPGLVVYPGGQLVVWRGVEHAFHPTEGRVLVALAGLWPRPIRARDLTQAVWGRYAAYNLASVYVRYIRRRAPGLVETLGPRGTVARGGGYRLALGGEA